MNFAVVKFINETDMDEEVVSEVPYSWLTKNNEYCLWPPDKYASIYITKNFPPQDDWTEYPIELECFCETLTEAKQKAKGKSEDKVGRGFRKIKPLDYFSPAEEEEKMKEKKKDAFPRKCTPGSSTTTDENYHANFLKMLNDHKKDEMLLDENTNGIVITTSLVHNNVTESCIHAATIKSQNTSQSSAAALLDDTSLLEARDTHVDRNSESGVILHQNVTLQDNTNTALTSNDENSGDTLNSNSGSGVFSAASIIADRDILVINKKLDNVCSLLSQFKVDLTDIKQRLEELSSPAKAVEVAENLPQQLPLKTLTELENLEQFIKQEKSAKVTMAKYFRNIGGNDYKDFTIRICKNLFTNSLAEACSWTGRKNNFSVGNLELINIIFGVVHHKTRCSQKDFEMVMAEWLRHAKQRREREDSRRNN